jgi:uncharacterized membrane protein
MLLYRIDFEIGDEMPQSRTRKLVITGVMGAITILLGVTHWGFIPWFGGISLTIMHVPVIIAAILEGPIVGLGVGLIFGIFSMLQAALAPTSPNDFWFTDPQLAILPRLFIGPVAYYVWKILQKLPVIGLIVSGITGSLTNSILVLGMIGILGLAPWELVYFSFITNSLLEAGVSAFIVLIVVSAWRGIKIGKKQGSDL